MHVAMVSDFSKLAERDGAKSIIISTCNGRTFSKANYYRLKQTDKWD